MDKTKTMLPAVVSKFQFSTALKYPNISKSQELPLEARFDIMRRRLRNNSRENHATSKDRNGIRCSH